MSLSIQSPMPVSSWPEFHLALVYSRWLQIAAIAIFFVATASILHFLERPKAPGIAIVFAYPDVDRHIEFGQHAVRLIFNQPIDAYRSHLVLRSSFGTVELFPTQKEGAIDVILATMAVSRPGRYTLEWIVQTQDGRAATGRIPFQVNEPRLELVPSHKLPRRG